MKMDMVEWKAGSGFSLCYRIDSACAKLEISSLLPTWTAESIQRRMQLAFRCKISKDSLGSAGKYEQHLKGDEQGEVRKLQTFLFSCCLCYSENEAKAGPAGF